VTDWVPVLPLFVAFLLFPAVSALVLGFFPKPLRLQVFAVVNLIGALSLCLLTAGQGGRLRNASSVIEVGLLFYGTYVVFVVVQFLNIRFFAVRHRRYAVIAFLFPIALLALKYVRIPAPLSHALSMTPGKDFAVFFLGLSYMAFRLSHLGLEVRNGAVQAPNIWEHLSYAFFVPTLTVGPITPYSVFYESLHRRDVSSIPVGRSLLRIIVGLTKYLFLASLCSQLSYAGLLLDGHPHSKADFLVAVIFYYLYLYCNFSGYCDMAIGTAGLLGIEVRENFDDPLVARNLQEFWTRWHMTLSAYMRDMVFSPLSKWLALKMGTKSVNHAIAITIVTVFILIGIWHGNGWNFLLYGVTQGVGVTTVHYYNVFLKKSLGKTAYAAYHRNPVIRAAAVSLTFLYTAGSLFFFANTLTSAREILGALR
jgi:D-alanyl-lipoteichoic acid acyltransferase DltB (MBOAT superfamily)